MKIFEINQKLRGWRRLKWGEKIKNGDLAVFWLVSPSKIKEDSKSVSHDYDTFIRRTKKGATVPINLRKTSNFILE